MDSKTQELLLKLRKGATGGHNAKTVQAILALLPGWTIKEQNFIKSSTNGDEFATELPLGRHSFLHADRTSHIFNVKVYERKDADQLHAALSQFVVKKLPEVAKAKADKFYVTDLSGVVEENRGEDRMSHFHVSFKLNRLCKGYRVTSPDGATFDVTASYRALGYAKTEFADMFAWALANGMEDAINALLGTEKHVKAADRPREAKAGQILGHCAICGRLQVTHRGTMVLHGYNRPGSGFIQGECFGVRYDAYEISPKACEAYVPVLEEKLADVETVLRFLRSGKAERLHKTVWNRKLGQNEKVPVNKGEQGFAALLADVISDTVREIEALDDMIQHMQDKITKWKPGKLRTAT